MEYKWLLIFDPANSQLPIPSENAKPLPAHLARKSRTTAEPNDNPKVDEPFGDAQSKFIWSEFNTCKSFKNVDQVNINLSKPKQLWFYIGKTSTEAKAHYTGDLTNQRNDPEANFLESVRAVTAVAATPVQRRPYPMAYPSGVNIHAVNAARAKVHMEQAKAQFKSRSSKERPYTGKYAISNPTPYVYKPRAGVSIDPQALQNQRAFQLSSVSAFPQKPNSPSFRVPPMSPAAPMAPMMAAKPEAPLPEAIENPGNLKRVSLA